MGASWRTRACAAVRTAATTDAYGVYRIAFPPYASVFDLTVGPGTNLLVPETTKTGLTITTSPETVDDIFLGVTDHVSVTAVVKDSTGNPVSRATVVFDGAIGDGRFMTRGDTSDQGDVKQGDNKPELWPGEYLVTVAPFRTDPWALSTATIDITSTDPVELYVSEKVAITGIVAAFDGSPVSGATLTVTRKNAALSRQFATTTGTDGSYALAIDPGDSLGDAEYEVTVQPSLQSRLPLFFERIRVSSANLQHDIRLYDSTLAAGHVLDPGGVALADIIIAFYSTDLGGPNMPLLVGVGRTNELGEFVIPLPALISP